MGAEIVHHDDVAEREFDDQHLGDPSPEGFAIDRAVEDAGRLQSIGAQGGQEGQGAPLAMGCPAQHTRALRPPSPERRHVRLHPVRPEIDPQDRFLAVLTINEDKPMRIQSCLNPLPAPALTRHVRTQLLQREQTFFKS